MRFIRNKSILIGSIVQVFLFFLSLVYIPRKQFQTAKSVMAKRATQSFSLSFPLRRSEYGILWERTESLHERIHSFNSSNSFSGN